MAFLHRRGVLNKDYTDFPQIKSASSRCKHLYFYYDHANLSFMSIRLMTWAPYEVQIALNGWQWLKCLLDREGISYLLEGKNFSIMMIT